MTTPTTRHYRFFQTPPLQRLSRRAVLLVSPPPATAKLSLSPPPPPEAPCPQVLGPAPFLPHLPPWNNRSFVPTIVFPLVLVGRLHPFLISPKASHRNKTAKPLSTPGSYRSQANHFSLAQASSRRVLHLSYHEH
jgi:hypothetical protein